MRKFVVKYVDPASKQWLSAAAVQQDIVEGENLPQAIRAFYANLDENITDIKITEIYEAVVRDKSKRR